MILKRTARGWLLFVAGFGLGLAIVCLLAVSNGFTSEPDLNRPRAPEEVLSDPTVRYIG